MSLLNLFKKKGAKITPSISALDDDEENDADVVDEKSPLEMRYVFSLTPQPSPTLTQSPTE